MFPNTGGRLGSKEVPASSGVALLLARLAGAFNANRAH